MEERIDTDISDKMLKSRNLSSHTYNLDIADDIADKIPHAYITEFSAFYTKMNT